MLSLEDMLIWRRVKTGSDRGSLGLKVHGALAITCLLWPMKGWLGFSHSTGWGRKHKQKWLLWEDMRQHDQCRACGCSGEAVNGIQGRSVGAGVMLEETGRGCTNTGLLCPVKQFVFSLVGMRKSWMCSKLESPNQTWMLEVVPEVMGRREEGMTRCWRVWWTDFQIF